LITTCILTWALTYGIDPQLVHSIVKHESNYNPNAIGLVGEVGLMQIRPEYVPESAKQLLDPCTNIKRGILILKKAKEYCKHKADKTWINCYNLGIAAGSRIKHPKLFPYYQNVIKIYQGRKSATK
jgi:hypothetical protein